MMKAGPEATLKEPTFFYRTLRAAGSDRLHSGKNALQLLLSLGAATAMLLNTVGVDVYKL